MSPKNQENFLLNLELYKINGIGKKTAEKLSALGLNTCGDLSEKSLSYLMLHFGKYGEVLYKRARGIDNREVQPYWIPKSISLENTLSQNISKLEEVEQMLEGLMSELVMRLERKKLKYGDDLPAPKKAFVKLKTSTFKSHTMECILPDNLLEDIKDLNFNSNSMKKLESVYRSLFTELFCNLSSEIRLAGVGIRLASEVKIDSQLSLFDGVFQSEKVA